MATKEDLMGAEFYEFPIDVEPEEDDGDLDIQNTVTKQIEEAIRHFEEKIEPDLIKATEYYKGEPFGDEEEGRSKVVSTDVRDAILAQLPSLMRIFFSPEHVVEFRPDRPDQIEVAAQQTDYIRYIVTEDNPGFLTFYSWFKDALVRRIGVVKWWYDEFYRVCEERYTGLDEQALLVLLDDPDVDLTIESIEQGEQGIAANVRVQRKERDGRIRIAAVPREEFVYTPDARDLDSAPLVAHVREVAIEELVALGIDEDEIEKARGEARRRRTYATEGLEAARLSHGEGVDTFADEADDSQAPIVFAEAYSLIDADGDGVAELRMFQCIGPQFKIVNGDGKGEIVDEIPFAIITPDPEPHTIEGLGMWDLLHDVQRVKSQILRGTLNSLAKAIDPPTEVVQGEVNMQDVLNPEVNNIIRVRRPGMMREIEHAFVGQHTLPILELYDDVRENRSGTTKAAAGLDADSLQSSTKAAVAATLSGSQQRIELIARVFAETGVKRLFQGLLKMVVRHQDRERVVRLRNQWVAVDPRTWKANLDVTVNVGLGQGTPEDQLMALREILGFQRELMQTGSPLVSNVELRKTLAKAIEKLGWRNPDDFIRPWGEQEEQQHQQMLAQQPPQPDPATAMVEVERMKAEAEIAIHQAKLELEREKIMLQDDRERDKLARESALKEHEIELKHAADVEDAKLKAQVAADRAAMDADIKRETAHAKATQQKSGGDA